VIYFALTGFVLYRSSLSPSDLFLTPFVVVGADGLILVCGE
jgi:hypothetical protein